MRMALSCAYPCTLAMSTDGRAPWCKDVPVGISNVCSGVCGVFVFMLSSFCSCVGSQCEAFGAGFGGVWGHLLELPGLLGGMLGASRLPDRFSQIFGSHRDPRTEPSWAQVGTMLRPSRDMLGLFWSLSGPFEDFQVQLQLRRLSALIFDRL